MLLLSQLCRYLGQPISEGAWGPPGCLPPVSAAGRHARAAPGCPRGAGPGGEAVLSSAARSDGPPVTAQTPPASRGGRERDRAVSAPPAASRPCRALSGDLPIA